MKYSVVLVDDHQLFREGLKLLLKRLDCVGEIREAQNGEAFIDLLNDFHPDIVFMDIEMPVMDGMEATEKALHQDPELHIVALSMYGDENYYTRMINAGARGFMLKNSGIQEVENAIKNVMSGSNYFSQEIMDRLIQGLGKGKTKKKSKDLTEREEEVLYYICKGFSNQEIADALYLSKRTVDKHRENLLSKTRSKNTAGLVMYAVKNGIVDV